MKKGLTEILVILDRSGSMASVKDDMEKGYATFLEAQKQLPGECVITLVQFDTQGIDTLYVAQPVKEASPFELVPRGGTPLLDALGSTIVKAGERFAGQEDGRRPERVLCMIITDGQENSSREYTKQRVKEIVEHQREAYKWQFLYLGANVDAFDEARGMGIATASSSGYTPDSVGVQHAFAAAAGSAGRYRNPDVTVTAAVLDSAFTDEERKKMGHDKGPKK